MICQVQILSVPCYSYPSLCFATNPFLWTQLNILITDPSSAPAPQHPASLSLSVSPSLSHTHTHTHTHTSPESLFIPAVVGCQAQIRVCSLDAKVKSRGKTLLIQRLQEIKQREMIWKANLRRDWIKSLPAGLSPGSVVTNLPANAGHTASTPLLGRSPVPRSSWSLCARIQEPGCWATEAQAPSRLQWEASASQLESRPPQSPVRELGSSRDPAQPENKSESIKLY